MVGFDMSGTPELKASSLLSEAIEIFGNMGNPIDPLVRSRLKREAKVLTMTDGAAIAWQVLGMVATNERDKSSAVISFKNAISLDGSFEVIGNFAAAYQRLYDFDKAIALLDSFIKKNPYHINCLRMIASTARFFGHYSRLVAALTTLKKLLVDDEAIDSELKAAIDFQSIQEKFGRTDEQNVAAIGFVYNFAESKGVCPVGSSCLIMEDEYSSWIYYSVRVDVKDVDTLIELSLELCDAKAGIDNGYALFCNGISIGIEGVE
jgi:tetratricopeptide (TPR) repeat protein